MTNKYADLTSSQTTKTKAILQKMRGAAKGCIRKNAYGTEEKAKAAVVSMTAKYGKPMRHYHCPHCLLWHLASA